MSNKIQTLLAEAERQSQSPSSEKSSIAFAARQFTDATQAETVFQRLKEKLLRVEQWNAESGMSSYALFDENGNESKNKSAAVNGFIRITLPGSGKNDWVKIVEIHDAPDERILTVSPSPNPTEKSADEQTTSHFFTDDATNNFCLERDKEALNFYVVGLSEKANTADTENFLETIRNFATANLGHYLGIQKSEWTAFCENFLETGEDKKGER